MAAAVVGRSGQCTRTSGGVPSVGSIRITVISSWLVMMPLARNLIGRAEVEPQVNGWLDQRAARLTG